MLTLQFTPDGAQDTEAMMASDTFADLINRMKADSALRPALEADPWLALACYDLIRDGRQVVSLRPSDAARGTSPHGRPSQSPKDRAAA
jgi:hypothetical protein